MQIVNRSEFENIVGNTRNVMVDFYADWCGPCKMLAPILEQIAAERGTDLVVVKVNIEDEPDLAAHFNIKSIPYVMFFMDGEAKHSFTGFQPKGKFDSFLDITL